MNTSLIDFFSERGLALHPSITDLRAQQVEAVEWALDQTEPYLFINAPTGSGKTLLLATYGMRVTDRRWTYVVSTKALQDQVAGIFDGLPVMKGRGNFECAIGEEVFFRTMTAAEAPCTQEQWCPHSGRKGPDGEPAEWMCDYYQQRADAMDSPYRCTNYAQWLSYLPVQLKTEVLLADEAHNVEAAVCDFWQMFISARTAGRFKLTLPESRDVAVWRDWAVDSLELLPPLPKGRHAKDGMPANFGLLTLRKHLTQISRLADDQLGNWLLEPNDRGCEWRPIWGRGLVVPGALMHQEKTLFSSATLMGPDYIADTLGLPDGSWAYLDLPSTFDPSIRPINYSPVVTMNAAAQTPGPNPTRARMQTAIDQLIDYYIGRGVNYGLIHSVSKKYRDYILTESRWGFMMTIDAVEHARKVGEGEASILVTASHTEGWDGKDELCRFIIMPKVPFPDLSDIRTRIRKEEDSRSYDHKTLVAVVQGAGRGVRHKEDFCETWILDEAWKFIYHRRREWLPESFLDAYHHGVRL